MKRFLTGVNYWASHAGTAMWSSWNESVVDSDFQKLSELGIQCIRLFPIWSEFQPITQYCEWLQQPFEIRIGENSLPDSDAGFCGVDEVMINRFERTLELASKHNLKVCVGILTGWMSGRIFAPSALERRNLLTDPVAVQWELTFIQYFVRRFKDNKTIISWSSGNETDCLSEGGEASQWVWSQSARNAIRAIDPVRPITEDMHPLEGMGSDALRRRKGIFDITTVHTYSAFAKYASNERIDSMRGLLFGIAEARAYADITGKPCQIEETGTLGDFMCSRDISAGFLKSSLWSAFTQGADGLMWWCSNEQTKRTAPPYDWKAEERELGIFDCEGRPKPVAHSFKKFEKIRSGLPFDSAPPAKVDAVCVLQGGETDWGIILGSYVLSVQAGLNISFAHPDSIPESGLYFLPSLSGKMIRLEAWKQLLSRVKDGAVLYISYRDWMISGFEDITGNELIAHEKGGGVAVSEGKEYKLCDRLIMRSVSSEVLLSDKEGNPFFTVNRYGRGKVYFLAAPLEMNYCEAVGGFDESYSDIYKAVSEETVKHAVSRTVRHIGITEHKTDAGTLVIAINYSSRETTDRLTFGDNMQLSYVYYGNLKPDGRITLEPFDAAVFTLVSR